MLNWYTGWPTIRICVVGKEKINEKYMRGIPDLLPVILIVEKIHSNTGINENKTMGILMSLKATDAQLGDYLGQLTNINPYNLEIRCQNKSKDSSFLIKREGKLLCEYGIIENSILAISDASCKINYKLLEEEKIIPMFKKEHAAISTGDYGGIDEDEEMRLAIQESLKVSQHSGNEEQKEREPRTTLQIDTENANDPVPANVSKPKTPSTGMLSVVFNRIRRIYTNKTLESITRRRQCRREQLSNISISHRTSTNN